MARALAILALIAASSVAPGHAAAQNADKAEQAFQAGRALLNEGRYPEACEKFAESQREDPASGTLLALAYCQQLSGLFASAWSNYRGAAEIALREGHSDRYTAATTQVKGLEERLSRLTIVVPPDLSSLPGLRVTLNGSPIERAAFNTTIPVDGGTYRIEASAPGRATWSVEVAVQSENDKKTLTIEVLEPDQAPASAPRATAPAPPGLVAAVQPPRTKVPEDRDDSRTLERASLAVGIGALAGFAVGITFGVIAKSKNDASNSDGHCDERGCDARGIELRNDALTAADVSTWSTVAGGVLALGSAALWIGAKSSARSTRIGASFHPSATVIQVTEAF